APGRAFSQAWPSCRDRPLALVWSLIPITSERRLWIVVLRRFLHANRYPVSAFAFSVGQGKLDRRDEGILVLRLCRWEWREGACAVQGVEPLLIELAIA